MLSPSAGAFAAAIAIASPVQGLSHGTLQVGYAASLAQNVSEADGSVHLAKNLSILHLRPGSPISTPSERNSGIKIQR